MPLPMVHLAVMIQLNGGKIPTADTLLGCLAPDAIHMRPGAGREDKIGVHLFAGESLPPDDLLVVRFMEERCRENPAQKDFVTGYGVHLLTDRLWFLQMYRPFKEKAPAGLSAQEQRSLYYQETDQADFNLYYHVRWRPAVWQSLASAAAPEFLPYLSAEEIGKWQQRTLNWFGRLKQEPMIQAAFFTDEAVGSFVERAAEEMQGLL
ncbi:MAG: hypothetical protein Q7U74_03455 [Saprospiraceae bacterium]|nr:hypothetical protein [Saprospiraceae bacterium]